MATQGRPRTIKTPEEFDNKFKAYIASCYTNERPITLTGAIRALGLSSRSALDNYEDYEGFSAPVKRLKLRVAEAYEERLHGNSPTGAIFALKNMGWSDKSQLEHSGPGGGPIPVSRVEIVAGGQDS